MRILIASIFITLFVTSNSLAYKVPPILKPQIIFEYIDPAASYPSIGTYWVTDLTAKGTKVLDTTSKEDFFSSSSKNAKVALSLQGINFFEYRETLYKSNGTMKGTIPYRGFKQNIRHLFSHKNKICHVEDHSESRIFCFKFKGNQASTSLLLELPVSRRINKVASNAFDDRLLITSTTKYPHKGKYIDELWISNGNKPPILLASNPNYGYDPNIFVTIDTIYFVSNDSKRKTARITTISNRHKLPRKLHFKDLPLPKFVDKQDVFSSGSNLYFINNAEIFKINGMIINRSPIALLPIGYKEANPITVLHNQLLYSVGKRESGKNGRQFVRTTLYKMSLKTGEDTKLSEKLFPYIQTTKINY